MMDWNEFWFIVRYHLKEPFLELWELRKSFEKMRTIINICLILAVVGFFLNNRWLLGSMLILAVFLHFYNRVKSGDYKNAMRESYKKKAQDKH